MTGETLRDLYAAVHDPIIDLRLSRLRAHGTLGKEVDTELNKLELTILNKLEAALDLSLRASPPPNVRVESGRPAGTGSSGTQSGIVPPQLSDEASKVKKPVGRPRKSAS